MVANEYYASQTIYNIMANNPIEQNRYVGVYCPLFDDMLCLLLLLKDWLWVEVKAGFWHHTTKKQKIPPIVFRHTIAPSHQSPFMSRPGADLNYSHAIQPFITQLLNRYINSVINLTRIYHQNALNLPWA